MDKRKIHVAVISDLHLGTFGCQAVSIVQYLRSIQPEILILNGDIIDIWQFSKHYFPATHMQVIQEIFRLITEGTRVYYITGNHDEKLRKFSDLNMGNLTLTDKLVLDIDGKKTWIFHGDVFDATTKGPARILAKLGGIGYDLLILMNQCINFTLQKFGKEKMSFSKKVKNAVKKAVTFISDFENTAAELAIQQGYHAVICGHIHQPRIQLMKMPQGSVEYLNSGDWVEHCTSLEYYDHCWHLYTHPQHIYSGEKIRNTNLIPDVLNHPINILLGSAS